MFRIFATLARSARHEAEEALFDANAIRLLQQHLRDANEAFEMAKHELARVLAQESGESRQATNLSERLARLEADAGRALSQGDEGHAEKLAGRIAVLEDERDAHLATAAACAREAQKIRDAVDQAARRLSEIKRGLSAAKAADALQRTRGRLAQRGLFGRSGSLGAIREAEDALRRIKERQASSEEEMAAFERVERDLPIGGAQTDADLRPPRTDPKDVLARLKAKAGPGPDPASGRKP